VGKLDVKAAPLSGWEPVVSWRVSFGPGSDKFRVNIWVKDVDQSFYWDNLSGDAAYFIIYLLGLDGRRWADTSSKKLQVEGGVGKWIS
jgi:hypothetical protein